MKPAKCVNTAQCCQQVDESGKIAHTAETIVDYFVCEQGQQQKTQNSLQKIEEKMCEFHCDINREEDGHLVQAIQTILDAISSKHSV